MPLSAQSEKAPNGTETPLDPGAVREQLKRLLAHPLFTNSKRYPVLLAHTVEQALSGNASGLKERTIGVEAFGREPDYDVALDPVVRMTAAEVRKRLSQYYYDPEHTGELVIELPVGSYIPSFREPAPHPTVIAMPADRATLSAVLTPAPTADSGRARSTFTVRRWILAAGALLIAALAGYQVGRVQFLGKPTNLERFWAPFTASSNPVTYCLGEPMLAFEREHPATDGVRRSARLHPSDVITLARSIVPLVPRNGEFRVLAASNTDFAQLREGPSVLIGAYDNPWTMRVTRDLPFGFEYDPHLRKIVDRKSQPGRVWTLPSQLPHTKDYAIVARIYDNVTGQPVIILAGIMGTGTEAASEVVSNPVYLNALLQKAPKNWERLNLEAVIETHVIENHPGPPTVVAVATW